MFKKTFIRLMFVLAVVIAGILVLNAARSHQKMADSLRCPAAKAAECRNNMAQGEFVIWETLQRTIMTTIQY